LLCCFSEWLDSANSFKCYEEDRSIVSYQNSFWDRDSDLKLLRPWIGFSKIPKNEKPQGENLIPYGQKPVLLVRMQRDPDGFCLEHAFPIFFISLFSTMSFLKPLGEPIDEYATITIAVLFAIIAQKVVAGTSMPIKGYTTRADDYFNLAFLSVVAVGVENVISQQQVTCAGDLITEIEFCDTVLFRFSVGRWVILGLWVFLHLLILVAFLAGRFREEDLALYDSQENPQEDEPD